METGYFFRGQVVGIIDKPFDDGKTRRVNYSLGLKHQVINEYGESDSQTVSFRIPKTLDIDNILKYYHSLKGKLVEARFENRVYVADDGRKFTTLYVLSLIEIKDVKN